MKIVVLDGYAANPGDLSWERLEALGQCVVYPRTSANELLERAADAEILLTNKVIINKEAMEALPQLKYIGVLATGYNVVDVESLKKQLKSNKIKKVHLIPFTFAQSSQYTSSTLQEWTQQLQEAGYKVTTEMRCLGDLDAIMDIFENHIRHAEKFRRYSAKEMKLIAR